MSTSQASTASKLIIAIDFGTTFTGVAYYHTGPGSTDDCDIYTAVKDINVVSDWPACTQYTEKTPTIIAYCRNPPIWGGQVQENHKLQMERFKLGLEPNVNKHYGYGVDYDNSNGFTGHPGLPRKEPFHFVTDYLHCVHTYVQKEYLHRRLGDGYLSNQKISYMVTVPAIWKEKAMDLTRKAASKAIGATEDRITLIREPEAAALYCATICEEVGLESDDYFMVCDAGGGTVVTPELDTIC
jgi:molecular chaperone DnaK (HSP70)